MFHSELMKIQVAIDKTQKPLIKSDDGDTELASGRDGLRMTVKGTSLRTKDQLHQHHHFLQLISRQA